MWKCLETGANNIYLSINDFTANLRSFKLFLFLSHVIDPCKGGTKTGVGADTKH